ncbi:hypothetical protein N0V93_000408 [Gnomoniopsis smithogilvyi]|uniref:N-acetyltransferase domain-containing protein n=1 Tax=Gnomoniopsis smithogilvyi TaxID=1191159 RepID=A0A9W8Z045_9PEZI|nr:hypothetical protein N0V93_000408 [Gnomoniopsis smithogilvyi]
MASIVPSSSKLQIRPATPSDVPELVRIHFDAFGPGVMDRLMHPDGGSASARANFGNSFFPQPKAASEPSLVEHITMVAELVPAAKQGNGQPEIIAFGKWKLVKKPLPEAEWSAKEEPLTVAQLGEGSDPAVYNVFLGGLHELRKKWMRGDPALHLGILACTTTRQRLGAGSALLDWGNALADREGMVHWLEASPQGYALYKRFGFEEVEAQDLRVTEIWGPVRGENEDWGAKSAVKLAGELPEGVFRTVVMRRFPQKGQT